MPKKQRARKAMLTGVAAAGLTGTLVIGHATNATIESLAYRLAASPDTELAVGGLFDPSSDRVQYKLQGALLPTGYAYQGIPYPATTDLEGSRIAGTQTLHLAITSLPLSESAHLIVAGYSEGTLVAEQERRDLQAMDPASAPSPDQLSFLQLASPFAANGGIYNRFPGISIPGVTDAMGAAQPTRYDTTYIALEYDSYADFPAYFNPVALLNTLLGIRYSHPDPAYDPINATNSPSYVTTVDPNTAGGKDTYVLIYNPHLPLLGPLRDVSSILGISALTEPFISAIEPLLRLAVDMAYTDRVNADPTASVPFSFITPPEKIIEAIEGIPGAIAQGLTNFLSGGAVQAPPNPIGNLQPSVPLPTGTTPATQPVTSQARAALVTAPEVSPEVSPEKQSTTTDSTPTVAATPTPTATATPTATTEPTTASDSTPTADPAPSPTVKPAESTSTPSTNDLHPTATSDGNKFTPGTDGAPAQSTGSGGTTPSDPEKPTTTTTGTTTAPTTATDPAASETKPSDPKPSGSTASSGSAGGSSSAGAAAA